MYLSLSLFVQLLTSLFLYCLNRLFGLGKASRWEENSIAYTPACMKAEPILANAHAKTLSGEACIEPLHSMLPVMQCFGANVTNVELITMAKLILLHQEHPFVIRSGNRARLHRLSALSQQEDLQEACQFVRSLHDRFAASSRPVDLNNVCQITSLQVVLMISPGDNELQR